MAADKSVMFQGFTRMAPAPRDWDAPVNSLRISTPASHVRQFFAGSVNTYDSKISTAEKFSGASQNSPGSYQLNC